MRCNKAQEYLSLEIDGLLPPDSLHELDRHLETCDDCLEYRADLQLGQRLLAKNIQHRACNPAFFQRPVEILFDHQVTSTDIDKQGAGFHGGKAGRVHQARGRRSVRQDAHHII